MSFRANMYGPPYTPASEVTLDGLGPYSMFETVVFSADALSTELD